MKKFVAVLLALVLTLGCVSAMAATGMGSVTSISGKDASADNNGSATVNTTYCSVTIDEAGVITAISFDVAQNVVGFDAAGAFVLNDAKQEAGYPTKNELKEGYGMKAISGIGKELYEQVASLEEYCIGKTVEAVLATETYDKGDGNHTQVPAGDDLNTTVTITIGGFLDALAKAAANAK